MNELYLSLAGIRVRVTAEAFGPMDFLAEYWTEPGPADHSFRAELTERFDPPTGEKICDRPAFRVYRDGDNILRDVGTAGDAYLRTVRQGRDGILSFRRDKLLQAGSLPGLCGGVCDGDGTLRRGAGICVPNDRRRHPGNLERLQGGNQ